MVEPATTDEPDSLATFVRDHTPAVDLLLVHPAWPIEGLNERWVQELNLKRNAKGHPFPLCHVERGFARGLRAGPLPHASPIFWSAACPLRYPFPGSLNFLPDDRRRAPRSGSRPYGFWGASQRARTDPA